MPSMDRRRLSKPEDDEGAIVPNFGNNGTPIPSFVPHAPGGGGPVFNVNPNFAAIDASRVDEVEEYEDDDVEELRRINAQLLEQNRLMRREITGGSGGPSLGGLSKEGVIQFLTGEIENSATMTIPTQGFVVAEMRLIREEVMVKIEEVRAEMREELKELREVALPLLKMLSTLSKD